VERQASVLPWEQLLGRERSCIDMTLLE
jgi:hypothetical protein